MSKRKNAYAELKQKHQLEYNAFPIGAAFSDEQFDRMMIDWGFYPSDTKKIVSIGYGCFVRKSDLEAYTEMIARHEKEMKEAFAQDTTGEGFIYDAFYYELCNHEYCYTGDVLEAVVACGLSWKTIKEDPVYDMALRKAARDVMQDTDF